MSAPATIAAASAAPPQRVLTFMLEGELFAIDAQVVREILEVPVITRVPGAPAFANGLVNVRGAIVPLTDLAVAFGLHRAVEGEDARVIVVETAIEDEQTTFGILADKVVDVASLDGTEIETAPTVGMRWRPDYIRGIARRDGQFVVLPDLDVVITEGMAEAARRSTQPRPGAAP